MKCSPLFLVFQIQYGSCRLVTMPVGLVLDAGCLDAVPEEYGLSNKRTLLRTP